MIMTEEIVITVDKGVPHPGHPKRGTGSLHTKYHDKLTAMAIGDSFFLRNTTREDITPLLRYAKRININLSARDTDEDEVYMHPGVRVWRVDREDLPGPKGDDSKSEAPTSQEDVTPSGDETLSCLRADNSRVRYWHHPESEDYFSTAIGEDISDDVLLTCVEISKQEYDDNTL